MKAIATLLIASLCLAPALAQDELPEAIAAEEEIRRYTVEVIIFSYAEEVAVGGERFFADEPANEEELDEFAEGLDLVDELSITPTPRKFDLVEYAKNAELLKLVLLTEDEYTMTRIAHQFELLDVYETIMHFGWTQPTVPHEETEAIELSAFGDVPEGLEGSLTLYLSRYLHLVVDLALEAEDEITADNDRGFGFGYPEVQELPTYYRIQENRIVKNGDIRYFDHPKFGVVAKVTRVDIEEPEDEDSPESELLLSLATQ